MSANPTDTLTTIGAIGLLSVLPTVNPDALIGAFSGAAIYALHNRDEPLARKVFYVLLSFVLGYVLGPEAAPHFPIMQTDTAGAFAVSSFVITMTTVALDRVRNLDFAEFFSSLSRRK